MSMHSVVRVTVLSVAPLERTCRIYKAGDVFYIRQHCFDIDVSSVKHYCYHSLHDLYKVYTRVRNSQIGTKETVGCRDKAMVHFEVERIADEDGIVGRSENTPLPLQ